MAASYILISPSFMCVSFSKKIVLFHYLVSSGKSNKKIKRVEYLHKSTGHLTFDNKIISQKS